MDGRGPTQVPGKDGRLVKTAVAIDVLQPPNLSTTLFALRIIIHLDDEEPPVLIECQRDWIGDQRLGGDEFEAKPSIFSLHIREVDYKLSSLTRRRFMQSGIAVGFGTPVLAALRRERMDEAVDEQKTRPS